MLEKPDLADDKIIACVLDEYGLQAVHFEFLPLGADQNTAVYRLVTFNQAAYFVKLRRGSFEELSVILPEFFHSQGIMQIIAPLPTTTRQLWADLEDFKVILYPFVEGHNGYEARLLDDHWITFGKTLKSIHTIRVPTAILERIQIETYPPQARMTVRRLLKNVYDDSVNDPIVNELITFLHLKCSEILDLVRRAEKLARKLQSSSSELIICHSDLHAGNLLVDADDDLYIVDWDNPILAPKERDLMFVGGGQFGAGRTPQQEEALFYQGYGPTQIDPIAMAYYRYERIVQDIAADCEQILMKNEGGDDREQSLQYLKSNFLPNNTIEIAYQSDQTI
ncbi:MAG TPA: phosphotransferase [Leptolinea sp.]